MANAQAKQSQSDEQRRETGQPGAGAGRTDEVGKSGVYPVSEMEGASPEAVVHGESSFGQGERGAEGYKDSGTSGIFFADEKNKDDEDNQQRGGV